MGTMFILYIMNLIPLYIIPYNTIVLHLTDYNTTKLFAHNSVRSLIYGKTLVTINYT